MEEDKNRIYISQASKLKKYLEIFSKNMNCILTEEGNLYGPQHKIEEGFFDEYIDQVLKVEVKNYKDDEFIYNSILEEYKFIELINCLNKAKLIWMKYRNQANSNTNSQLIIVNNIIKNDFYLISYIMLIEWLEKLEQLKNEHKEIIVVEKFDYNSFAKYLVNQKNFTTDFFLSQEFMKNYRKEENNKKNKYDSKEISNFTNIIEKGYSLIRSGQLDQATILFDYYNLPSISSILFGGLPSHDFILDSESYPEFDYNLLPPCMKTLELKERANQIRNHNMKSDTKNLELPNNERIGNHNWLLYIMSNFNTAENENNNKFIDLQYLFSILSGNPNPILNNHRKDFHDTLYALTNNLLISNLIEKYQKIDRIDYDQEIYEDDFIFVENLNDYKKPFSFENIKYCNNIDEVLSLSNKEIGMEFDVLSELQSEYISLHFNLFENSIFLLKLNKLLGRMKEHIEDINSKNNNLVYYHHFKIIFLLSISLYSLYFKFFDLENSQYVDYMISSYFHVMMQISNKPEYLIYISSYSIIFENAKNLIITYAKQLTDDKIFEIFIKDLNEWYHENIEIINTSIAVETNLYQINNNLSNIEDVLKRDLLSQLVISQEDMNKIYQINILFTEKNFDFLSLRYIFNIIIRFISTNKIKEVFYIFENTNLSQYLNIKTIFYRIPQFENSNENDIDAFLESNSNLHIEEYRNINIQFAYYFVLKLISNLIEIYKSFKLVRNEFNNKPSGVSFLEEKINMFVMKCNLFSNYTRLFHTREDIPFLIESIFDKIYLLEIKSIFSKWLFQIIKWSHEIGEFYQKLNYGRYNYHLDSILSFVNFNESYVQEEICIYLNDDLPKIEKNVFNSLDLEDQKYVLSNIIFPLTCSNNILMSQVLNQELLDKIREEIKLDYSYLNKD